MPGDRVRVRSEVYDGELMSFSWCPRCCAQMENPDTAIEAAEASRSEAEVVAEESQAGGGPRPAPEALTK